MAIKAADHGTSRGHGDSIIAPAGTTETEVKTAWWQQAGVQVALIAIVGALVYSGTFSVPFVFDDMSYVLRNHAIKDPRFILDSDLLMTLHLPDDLYKNIVLRPVAYLSFALNYYLHGFQLPGYHLVNLAIHLAGALLVYLITRMTLTRRTVPAPPLVTPSRATACLLPLATALVFATHPLQTQSVTYITQRFTSLVALFYLLSLTLYSASESSRDKTGRVIWYAGSLASAIIAMKTKENAFTLPLMLLVYDLLFCSGSLKLRVMKLAPFLLTMLIIPVSVMNLSARFTAAGNSPVGQSMNLVNYTNISKWQYLCTQFGVITTYLRMLVLPVNQSLDHDIPLVQSFWQPQAFLPFLLLLVFLAAGLHLLYRGTRENTPRSTRFRLAAFGVFWFFITLSVESSIIPLEDLLVEQRVYLPSVGFFWFCFTGLALLLERSRIGITLFAAITGLTVCALSLATFQRNLLWKDPVKLWGDTARKSPGKARPYQNLGAQYLKRGMFPEALAALQASLRINPDMVDARLNMANVLTALEQYDEAEAEYHRVVKLQPGNELVYNALGWLYFVRKDFEKALPMFQRAVGINPYYFQARANLALVYETMGQRELAIAEYSNAFKLEPNPVIAERLDGLRMQGH